MTLMMLTVTAVGSRLERDRQRPAESRDTDAQCDRQPGRVGPWIVEHQRRLDAQSQRVRQIHVHSGEEAAGFGACSSTSPSTSSVAATAAFIPIAILVLADRMHAAVAKDGKALAQRDLRDSYPITESRLVGPVQHGGE
jgi:hypothetical protein